MLRFFIARQIKISQFNALENGTSATAAGSTVDINWCTTFALILFLAKREYDFPLLAINDCCVVLRWELGDIRGKQPGVKWQERNERGGVGRTHLTCSAAQCNTSCLEQNIVLWTDRGNKNYAENNVPVTRKYSHGVYADVTS